MFCKDTRCTDGIVDCLERYLLVWSGIVDGLEGCLRYGVSWKGISFAKSNAQIRGIVGSMRCIYS
jgi:hypothetical protein